jgi:hypothetical protein
MLVRSRQCQGSGAVGCDIANGEWEELRVHMRAQRHRASVFVEATRELMDSVQKAEFIPAPASLGPTDTDKMIPSRQCS